MAEELVHLLTTPTFPIALLYIWDTWCRLRRRTRVASSGPVPISWRDIEAFTKSTGISLNPIEIAYIEGLDDIFIEHSGRETRSATDQHLRLRDGMNTISKQGLKTVKG